MSEDTRNPLPTKANAEFEEYYTQQLQLGTEDLVAFFECLRTRLPTSFRVSADGADAIVSARARAVQDALQKHDLNPEDTLLCPQPLKWFSAGFDISTHACSAPEHATGVGSAWVFEGERVAFRGKAGPTLASDGECERAMRELHATLLDETEHGGVCRQEVVSMLPVVLLNPQPNDLVLDMCAAPGSKTSQIIEAMQHRNVPTADLTRSHQGGPLVVANDADYSRCFMLLQRIKKLSCPFLLVTNTDAHTSFPSVVSFDRVLCDVPCSGDGTLRKDPALWPSWDWRRAHELHRLQAKLLRRACELVRPGGRVVYSTCSLNPIENEAVVATVLGDASLGVHVCRVAPHDKEHAFSWQPGLSTWRVRSSEGWYAAVDEIPGRPAKRQRSASFFPPAPDSSVARQLCDCIRVLPHTQNTGGFFVAVLERMDSAVDSSNLGAPQQSWAWPIELPDTGLNVLGSQCDKLFNVSQSIKRAVASSYGLDPQSRLIQGLISRGERRRLLYTCSPAVCNVLLQACSTLKVVNAGVRVFEWSEDKKLIAASHQQQQQRQHQASHENADNDDDAAGDADSSIDPTTGIAYRVCSHAAALVASHVSPQVIPVESVHDMRTLLTANGHGLRPSDLIHHSTTKGLEAAALGCCVFVWRNQNTCDGVHGSSHGVRCGCVFVVGRRLPCGGVHLMTADGTARCLLRRLSCMLE